MTDEKGTDGSRISFQFDRVPSHSNHRQSADLRAAASKKSYLLLTPQLTSSEYPDFQAQIGGNQISYSGDGLVVVGSQVVGKCTRQGVLV
jgi:hypothetical protein